MSKLLTMREDLAASIIAANIGWSTDNILLKRQTDLWNDVATAISASANNVVLHIGVAEGTATEEDGLEMDITVPLTILCPPQVPEGSTPEEDLWEQLLEHVHDLRLGGDPHTYRFRFKSFSDSEVQTDDGTGYLARQTLFTRRLSL